MSTAVCHDFKTPRADASRRLPQIFMLVPVLFYLVILGGGFTGVTSYLSYRTALKDKQHWAAEQARLQAETARTEVQLKDAEQLEWRSQRIAQWIEGTRAMQPITVAINRSVSPEITLSEMLMERSAELPSQINISVRINNGGVDDVTRIQNAIAKLSYRPYNSQQLKSGDLLEYRSMLVWRKM